MAKTDPESYPVKNPEAAREGDIKVGKNTEKLLSQAQEELARWENYATDSELMAQLREEAGIKAESTDLNREVRSNTEKDKDVETFLKRFAPQMDAIIAKNRIEARGNLYDDDLKSIAMNAAANAYEKYDPAKGASLDTAASTYVGKAIIDFNRKQFRDFNETKGNISLDQTNEQGEALHEAVADENETKESDSISARENPQEAKRRITESKKLSPVQKKIVDLSFTKIGKLTKNYEFFSLTIWLFVFFGVYLIAIDIVAYVKPVTTTK